ncbi:MAG: protein kinase domain-containing protein [Gemmatimonadaceae bacterium]
MSLPSGTTLGPYEILELIGAGGMGEVYRARDSRLDRSVAVKTIRGTTLSDAEATRRLISEARTAAAINHPNITQIYDIGERDGLAYVVMELVQGISLEAKLAVGRLPVAEVISIGRSLASALTEAHRRGVIHRDIKPANILVTPTGQVKVLDFGIAKLVPTSGGAGDLSVTSTGMVIGTAAYMSPEQAVGDRITPATDVFSAGIVLYQMATGVLPFTGTNMFQIIDSILHEDPPSLSRSDMPLELQRVIQRALNKISATRYADGAALEEALAAVDSDRPALREKLAIAVLSFEDLSPGLDNEYFSSGLTEEITVALSNINSLAVVSRTTTNRYKGGGRDVSSIAADLKVRYLLGGSVRKVGDALRITAQLIDAADNSSVWAETYKGTLQNVFEIQEEVARKIVGALMVKLSPAEKVTLGKWATLDAEAFDLYLKGRHHLGVGTKRDLQLALAVFERALVRDPRYAAAHAGVAEAAAAYYEYYERTETWLDRAVESALKALMYDATLGEAYAALALAYFNKGSLDDSRAACKRAIELDPENWIGYWTLGRIHFVTGRTPEAIELLKRVIALNPEFYVGYFTLRMVCQSIGSGDLYRPYLTRLVDEIFPRYLEKNPSDARARNSFGMELSMAGRLDEGRVQAERALAEAPDDPMILYATACYYSVFAEPGPAIEMLGRAIDAGFANFPYLEQDPDLRPLHGETAYKELMQRHGRVGEPGAATPGSQRPATRNA